MKNFARINRVLSRSKTFLIEILSASVFHRHNITLLPLTLSIEETSSHDENERILMEMVLSRSLYM